MALSVLLNIYNYESIINFESFYKCLCKFKKKLRQQCMLITKYTKGKCKQFKFMSKKEIIAVNYCISYLIVH